MTEEFTCPHCGRPTRPDLGHYRFPHEPVWKSIGYARARERFESDGERRRARGVCTACDRPYHQWVDGETVRPARVHDETGPPHRTTSNPDPPTTG